MPYKLDNWSVKGNASPYTAPECYSLCLTGTVTGHPRFADGDVIRTSSIKDAKGRFVHTNSGSIYKLGKINPKYRAWLKKNRSDWNHKIPITIV